MKSSKSFVTINSDKSVLKEAHPIDNSFVCSNNEKLKIIFRISFLNRIM